MKRALVPAGLVVAAVACGPPPAAEPTAARPVTSARPVEAAPLLPGGRVAVRSVAVNYADACALFVDGRVWCYGNVYETAGMYGVVHQIPLVEVRSIAGVEGRMYALTQAGEVFAWGADNVVQGLPIPQPLGVTGAREIAVSPTWVCVRSDADVRCSPPGDFVPETQPIAARAISAGVTERCAATDAEVVCRYLDWSAANPKVTVKRPIPGVVELVASRSLTCARTIDRRVRCWRGRDDALEEPFSARAFATIMGNENGICALPTTGAPACVTEAAPDPEDDGVVPAIDDVMRTRRGVTAMVPSVRGATFVEAGQLWRWGDGRASLEPMTIDFGDASVLRAARDVGVGSRHTCVLGLDDGLRCWGNNAVGAMGLGAADSVAAPERVPDLPPVAALAVGPQMTCVVSKARGDEPAGRVLCMGGWTDRGNADCVDGAAPEPGQWPCMRGPTLVTSGAVDVTLGDDFGCVLDADGGVRCWGKNRLGQLGSGDAADSATPRPVVDATGEPLRHVRKVVAADRHACALLDGEGVETAEGNATLTCWGYDDPGEQGRPLDAPPILRVATPLPTGRRVVDVSDRCFVLEGGETHCWGLSPRGGFAQGPARIGACDATAALDEQCVTTAEGVTCVGKEPHSLVGGDPIALVSAAAREGRVCGVDAAHRVFCRRSIGNTPEIGDALLRVVPPTPTDVCPVDEGLAALQPIAPYQNGIVTGGERVRPMTDDEVKLVVRAARTGERKDVGTCSGDQDLTFQLHDGRGDVAVEFVYVGPPCEGLLRLYETDRPYTRLPADVKAPVRKLVKELGRLSQSGVFR